MRMFCISGILHWSCGTSHVYIRTIIYNGPRVDSKLCDERDVAESLALGLNLQGLSCAPIGWLGPSFIDCSQFAAKMVEKEGSDPNPYPDSPPLVAATTARRSIPTTDHSLLNIPNTDTPWQFSTIFNSMSF